MWILFTALLACFTIATLPQQYLTEDLKKDFLIPSIILGFIQLSIELRQFFYKLKYWWQFFGMYNILLINLTVNLFYNILKSYYYI